MAVFALLERLAPLIEREVNLVLESKKEVENLSGKLKKIQEIFLEKRHSAIQQIECRQFFCFTLVQSNSAMSVFALLERLAPLIQREEFKRIESTSSVDSASVYGRSIDKQNLIQNLLTEGDSGVEIVSIAGTGGVGWNMNSIPQGVERLTGLWILSSFNVGRGSGKLGYLRKLNQLRGSLELILGDLSELEDLDDAKKAELKNKKYIQKLSITFRGEVRVDIMEALQPPPNLHYFRMCGYKGTHLPVWITSSVNYLRVLVIEYFEKCSSLPPLGKLPKLEELKILWMRSMKYVGNEFLGIMGTTQKISSAETRFPKLRKLCIYRCDNWEKWEDITGDEKDHLSIMPCLRELEIVDCNKLKALPHCLLRMASSLEYLTVKSSLCLASLYGDRTGDEWDKISHIPHIKVDSLEDINRKRLSSQ
ncbi:unnamed protein product [Fraxinus pennsylvanica]|uniref:R13L1/DRL21-like LRR repeat region domain-containing protein n=1 Tax=Fraxinus pennsylvanica TaxID=56036 RepID=A0AAD2A283_9LAMI|nr:unnamed protein product [Fraxinus pennsylvanica]